MSHRSLLPSSSPGMTKAEGNDGKICDDNLCFNGGKCDPINNRCICVGHFIGERQDSLKANSLTFVVDKIILSVTSFGLGCQRAVEAETSAERVLKGNL